MIYANCLICNEPIPVRWVYDNSPKICQKCKDAVMLVRKNLERCKRYEPVLDSGVMSKE